MAATPWSSPASPRRLGSDDRFRIVTADAHDPGIVARLESASAHVLIVDLNVVPVDEALALVRQCHDLTLIGLDPGGGELVAFSAERTRHLAVDDLVRLIEQSVGACRRREPLPCRSSAGSDRVKRALPVP